MAVKHKIDVIFVENLLKLIAEVLEMDVSQLKRMASFEFSAQTSAMISDFSSRSLKGKHVKNIRAGRHIEVTSLRYMGRCRPTTIHGVSV